MKELELEKYRSAWKKESGFKSAALSDDQIRKFLQANSKSIQHLFRAGLTVDIILKSLLLLSFAGLIVLLMRQLEAVVVSMALLGICTGGIIYQLRVFRRIPGHESSRDNIRSSLETKIKFYNHHYIKSLFVGALSNSLFFLAGTMYYFRFKYGEIRPFHLDDYLVFGGAVILSFALGAFVQIMQHNFQIRQLESCLNEIDEDSIRAHTLRNHRMRRIRNIIILSLFLILGLLLLSYLIMIL